MVLDQPYSHLKYISQKIRTAIAPVQIFRQVFEYPVTGLSKSERIINIWIHLKSITFVLQV